MVKIKKALVIIVMALTKVDQTIVKSVENVVYLLVNYDLFVCFCLFLNSVVCICVLVGCQGVL